eukprot:TRINITY_DN106134_c0_g1_i1.p1 TRINITY_DN106134_c0_g1~~TRINITY_DN106134_c0_g1_i1.p1  ORF type:complete len:674 (-),score=116.83 TRINITY_DN106134_c0_g1_i1:39-2060(-)
MQSVVTQPASVAPVPGQTIRVPASPVLAHQQQQQLITAAARRSQSLVTQRRTSVPAVAVQSSTFQGLPAATVATPHVAGQAISTARRHSQVMALVSPVIPKLQSDLVPAQAQETKGLVASSPIMTVTRSPQLTTMQSPLLGPQQAPGQRSPLLTHAQIQHSPTLKVVRGPVVVLQTQRSPALAPAQVIHGFRSPALASPVRSAQLQSPATQVLSPQQLIAQRQLQHPQSAQQSKSLGLAPAAQEEDFELPPPVVGLEEDGGEENQQRSEADSDGSELDADEHVLEKDSSMVRSPCGTHYVSSSKRFALDHHYTIWFEPAQHMKRRGRTEKQFEAGLQCIGSFNSVQEFWRYWNAMDLERMAAFCSISVFRNPIKPMWEDPLNQDGGQWALKCSQSKAVDYFTKMALSLIGGYFDCHDELCGVVMTTKQKFVSLSLWIRQVDSEVSTQLGLELKELLGVENDLDVTCEFKNHGQTIVQNSLKRGEVPEVVQAAAKNSSTEPQIQRSSEPRRADAKAAEEEKPRSGPAQDQSLRPTAAPFYPSASSQDASASKAKSASKPAETHDETPPVEKQVVDERPASSAAGVPAARATTLKVSQAAISAANAARGRGQYAYQSGYYDGTFNGAEGYESSFTSYNMYYGGAEYPQSAYYDVSGQFHGYPSSYEQKTSQAVQK